MQGNFHGLRCRVVRIRGRCWELLLGTDRDRGFEVLVKDLAGKDERSRRHIKSVARHDEDGRPHIAHGVELFPTHFPSVRRPHGSQAAVHVLGARQEELDLALTSLLP